MFAIAGRVIVEGPGSAIPDVLVEAFDVTKAGTRPGPLSAAALSWVVQEPTLGSAITDEAGEFEWTAEGVGSFPVQLVVAVFGTGPRKTKELLYLVERVRSAGEGTHRYVIAVPADVLRRVSASGLGTAAARVAAAREQSRAVNTLRAGAKRARAGRVDAVRKARAAAEASVVGALIDRDNAPARDSAGLLSPSVVPLGASVRQHMSQLIDATMQTSAQAFTARGLIDLSDQARTALVDGSGNPNPGITQDDIRHAVFGGGFADGTPDRHRRDLVAVACRLRTPPYDRCGDGDGGTSGGGGDGEGGEGTAAQHQHGFPGLQRGRVLMPKMSALSACIVCTVKHISSSCSGPANRKMKGSLGASFLPSQAGEWRVNDWPFTGPLLPLAPRAKGINVASMQHVAFMR